MLSYVNNKFCSLDKAQISVNDRGYQFGDAVYEVIYYNCLLYTSDAADD